LTHYSRSVVERKKERGGKSGRWRGAEKEREREEERERREKREREWEYCWDGLCFVREKEGKAKLSNFVDIFYALMNPIS
jgi:hypothetical protein